jgi:NADH:ubiquinone oxidoreductase subunit 5 (subunit L)/multisubunit Na+/H+ antiporter MnhA subunit
MHSLGFCISSLSLIGFPFLAGFFSKDLCLDYLLEFNLGFFNFSFFFFGCVLTVFYSFRIFLFGLNSSSLLNSSLNFSYSFFSYFYVFLIFFSIFGGKLYSFLFLLDELLFSFGFLKMIGFFLIFFLIFFSFIKSLLFIDFFSSMFRIDLIFGHTMSFFFFQKNFFLWWICLGWR